MLSQSLPQTHQRDLKHFFSCCLQPRVSGLEMGLLKSEEPQPKYLGDMHYGSVLFHTCSWYFLEVALGQFLQCSPSLISV